ncbi:MAG: hypothetical protein WDN26_21790 [Chitinophagaceae bacterium]
MQNGWKKKNTSVESRTEELLETASQSPAQSHRIVVKNGSKIKIIPGTGCILFRGGG